MIHAKMQIYPNHSLTYLHNGLVKNMKSEKNSVTRFGEILPLWQNFKNIGPFFDGLFCIGQNFEPIWANF